MNPYGQRRPIPFDDGMLLVASAERILAYNSSARRIWYALAEGHTPADISATLAEAHQVHPDTVAAELDAIVAHWREAGLLDRGPNVQAQSGLPHEVEATGDIEWAARWLCRFGERLVEFAAQDLASATLLRGPLGPLEVPDGTPEARVEIRGSSVSGWRVHLDGRAIRTVPGATRLEGLKEAVYEALLGCLWPERSIQTLIHAAAVARGGIGLCFPAASGSGKSTLTAHLCGQGYQYLTDDLTALDASGEVLPLPIPMSLKQGSWTLLRDVFPELDSGPAFRLAKGLTKWITPAGALSARPAPLTALVFTSYVPGRTTVLESIRPFEALLRLREAGLWLGHPLTDDRVANFAARLERTPAYSLRYATLPDALDAIERLIHDLVGRSDGSTA